MHLIYFEKFVGEKMRGRVAKEVVEMVQRHVKKVVEKMLRLLEEKRVVGKRRKGEGKRKKSIFSILKGKWFFFFLILKIILIFCIFLLFLL